MSLELTIDPADQGFEDEVRTWLGEHLVGEFRDHLDVGAADDADGWDIRLRWDRELAAGGWLGLTWPTRYGGRNATLAQEIIFEYQYAKARAPYRATVPGTNLLGPTMLIFGSEAQKQRFLPKILAVEEMWGQGFSEPDAGSDLAALRTRARLDGDEWVIDGQKSWMTFGGYADWLFVLARTDPAARRHKGLSMLLVPVDQPGVSVRPVRNMVGASEFYEVFFTGARTAADMVLGDVDDGWRVAMGALGVERGSLLLPMQLRFEREADALLDLVRARTVPAGLRHRVLDAWIGVQVCRTTNLRTVAQLLQRAEPGAQATTSKLAATEQHQRLLELAMEVLGEEATTVGEGYLLSAWQRAYLISRAASIYGGTSQIQRNIIGERLLGLPKEPASAG